MKRFEHLSFAKPKCTSQTQAKKGKKISQKHKENRITKENR